MSLRALPLATAILGLATLGVFFALGAQPEVRAAYAASEISTAVSAFQRSQTLIDIIGVFGVPPDTTKIAAMDALNRLDLIAFVPVYALFLCAAAIMLGGLRNRWTQAAIVFALFGAAADAIETWKQLQLTADLANAGDQLPIAPWHWLKYAGLGLNGVAIASLCISSQQQRRILAIIALLPLPLVIASYVDLLSTRVFAGAFGLYWLALLVTAALAILKPASAAPAPGSPA